MAQVVCMPALVDLRYARNTYNSTVKAAEGFVSGRRVESCKIAERDLRNLLWAHRNLLIETLLEKHQAG